jgi:hypothetical protein
MLKSATPRLDTASQMPITPCFTHASLKAFRSLMRPDPVSQCAMNAHIGLCLASAFSTISPVTDWPCGVSTTVTLAVFGLSECAASSSLVAAFMRMVRLSMPEKVPLGNVTTLSRGRINCRTQSRPSKPVPATP